MLCCKLIRRQVTSSVGNLIPWERPKSVPSPNLPAIQIGPYKLLQQIGEGGMGVVYMAEQTEPVERRVALKIIKPGMDTRQVIARFEAERQALAMMDHPNIAKVLDAGTTDSGRPYFVMELVKGHADHGVLRRAASDAPRTTGTVSSRLPGRAACPSEGNHPSRHQAVEHSGRLLRRARPVPKVIDFGVAKAISQRLTEKTMFTQFGQIVGTLQYMSPEQAKFNQLDVDTRSDIYSLGVLLYELLTGNTPFDKQRLRSAAFDEMLRIIREEEPPRPSTRLSSSEHLPSIAVNRKTEPTKLSGLVRGELDWIVMRALEKDRTRRYETASSFAADVQHYLNDEAVVACPPSTGYRLRKFVRRNKSAITTATVMALALLTAVGSIGWSIRDRVARHQQQEMERASRQTRLTTQVGLILEEVERLIDDKQWGEALAAARRAEVIIESGEVERDTHQRVGAMLADVTLVAAIEEVRLQSSQMVGGGWDRAGTDRGYARVPRGRFWDYGHDCGGRGSRIAGARQDSP